MLSSKSNAAKMPDENSALAKKFGKPFDVSECTGGRSTEAEKRPAVNSHIAGMKWCEQPNDYGHGVS